MNVFSRRRRYRNLLVRFAFASMSLALAVPSHAQTPPTLVAEWSICDVAASGPIAWHPDGYIVLASASQKIFVFTPSGALVQSWGSMGTEPGQFNGLSGVATGDGGTLFTSEESGRRVQRFTLEGLPIALWNVPYYPLDVAADGAGYVYLATAGDDDIAKYDVNGAVIDAWPCHPCWSASADHQGHIFAGSGREALKFTTSGGRPIWAKGLEVLPDDIPEAQVVVAGASGRVYASDPSDNHTLVLDGDGALLKWWSPASQGFAEDPQGSLYAVEGCTMRVYAFGGTTAVHSPTWGRLKQIYR